MVRERGNGEAERGLKGMKWDGEGKRMISWKREGGGDEEEEEEGMGSGERGEME